MKTYKPIAAALALGLLLAGCGATATASSSAASSSAAQADDEYAYLADFSYSDLFDDQGYVNGVTAGEYVTLPEDLRALELPAEAAEVDEEELQQLITEQVLTPFATTESVTDRAAEMGDSVNIDFVGSIDGEEFEGGSSGGAGYDLTLGSGGFIDDFEEQIAGHTPGETFTVEVTFPDPYTNNPDMAGKDAVFETTLNHINQQVIPELTDAFVEQNLSADSGWQDAKAVEDYYRGELRYSQQSSALYEQLDASVQYAEKLPENVDKFFTDWTLSSPYQYAQMYGVDLGTVLASGGFGSVEEYLDTAAQSITQNGQQILLVQALAEELGIVCDDAVLERDFPVVFASSDLETMRDRYGDGYLRMLLLERLVMNDLIENATKTAK